MASPREIFDVSGPLHLLTAFDWRNTFHRRSIAASLVQGVYVLEKDRQRRSTVNEHNSHYASPWWERFHFQLNHTLIDDTDSSYFGAIYELKYANPLFYQSPPYPPKFVIAFRGTITRSLSRSEDMKLNFKCIFDKLEESCRFRTGFEAVLNAVTVAGAANVWLAGHSLGASIAMLAGRNMAKSRVHLETYLFNPPYISVPIEKMIKNKTLKHGVRIAGSLVTAGIATAMKRRRRLRRPNPNPNPDLDPNPDPNPNPNPNPDLDPDPEPEEDPFVVLSDWTPNVFVNPSDSICAEYIGYFQHRDKMDQIGVGKIERIATRYSIGSLVAGAVGRDSESLHLVPTAYLTVNLSPSEDFKQAHGIHQWWQHHFQWQSKLYKYK